MKKILKLFLWLGCALTTSAFAFCVRPIEGLDISIAGGTAWYHSNNPHLEMQVTSAETDTLHVSSLAHTFTYSAGVGYHFYPEFKEQTSFLEDIFVQLNVTHDSATLTGNVSVFDMSTGNNYAFRAPISSTRLAVDVKPQLFTFYRFAPYAIAGAGFSWNQVSFHEIATSPQFKPGAISLPANNQARWIGDLGLGVRRPITEHFYLSGEYLATYVGDLTPSIQARSKQTVLSAPTFKLWIHSVMISAGWQF